MKFRTRIVRWNVCSLGSLSDQNAQLRSVFDTMKSRNIDLLILSLSCWPASGATNICGTTILHSGVLSFHTLHVGILLCPWAKVAWDDAGSAFQPVSECIFRICLKCHIAYMFVFPIYAPTNPPNSTSKSTGFSDAFYEQPQSTLSSDPASDLLVVMVISMLEWFLTAPL